MIRIDRERLIEAGGARVDHRLTKAKRVVLSGQVDEMMPDQGMSNTHTVFIDNSESVLNLNARLVEGEYEAFAQRVPDNCVELMIDDDGWLSGAINRGYITPEIWQCVVLEKLAADGFAVIGPIEKAVVVGLMTWLNRMLARGLRFYYDIETVNGQYKDFRLVVWRDGQIGVGEKGILAVNYSQTDAPKIESMFGGGGTLEDLLKLHPVDEGDIFSYYHCTYDRLRSLELEPRVHLRPLDQILYISYVEISKITGNRRLAVENLRRELSLAQEYLRRHPKIKYVVSLTWLASYMKALGMRKSRVAVEASAMRGEIEAINVQVFDYLTGSNRTPMLDSFVERMMAGEFAIEDVAYWYCRAKEFGGRLLK